MADPVSAQTIVFFDGVCHLCNSFVDFLVARDQGQRLRFASLQGKTAEQFLQPSEREKLETVLIWHQGRLFSKSEAVLLAFFQIGGAWGWFGAVARWIPRGLRDRMYDFVAKNRYAWFGQRDTCRIPTPEEKSRILD